MNQILGLLPPGSRVLDLGCRYGSFPAREDLSVVRLDIEFPHRPGPGRFVAADAARLPFPDAAFDAVIANHSLEHMRELDRVIEEIARVLKTSAFLYVSVPDSTTFTDKLYRWLGRGGGHVNPFTSAGALGARIQSATRLKLATTRLLYSSFSFLNRRNIPGRVQWKLWLLGGGFEWMVVVAARLLKAIDIWFGTRLSIYGWEFYFGKFPEPIPERVWMNVCVRCGAGHPALPLLAERHVRRYALLFRGYRCPACGAANLFTEDPKAAPQAE